MNEFVQTIVKYKVGNQEFNTNEEANLYLQEMKKMLECDFYTVMINPVIFNDFIQCDRTYSLKIPKGAAILQEKAFLHDVIENIEKSQTNNGSLQTSEDFLVSKENDFKTILSLQEYLEKNTQNNSCFSVISVEIQ